MNHEQARALIARRFQADLPPLEEQALRAHLRGCPDCKAFYDRHAAAEIELEGGAGQVDRLRQAGPRVPVRSRRRVWIGAAIAAAAALLVVFFIPRNVDQYVARGGDAGHGAWMRVYVKAGEQMGPAEVVEPGQGLLFSYSLERGAPHRFVAIAGRDAKGTVHWFHPAYEQPEDTPRSVPVEPGVADRELPDAVFVEAAPGPMEICAMFTADALDVKAVDGWLMLESGWWPNATTSCTTVTVK